MPEGKPGGDVVTRLTTLEFTFSTIPSFGNFFTADPRYSDLGITIGRRAQEEESSLIRARGMASRNWFLQHSENVLAFISLKAGAEEPFTFADGDTCGFGFQPAVLVSRVQPRNTIAFHRVVYLTSDDDTEDKLVHLATQIKVVSLSLAPFFPPPANPMPLRTNYLPWQPQFLDVQPDMFGAWKVSVMTEGIAVSWERQLYRWTSLQAAADECEYNRPCFPRR